MADKSRKWKILESKYLIRRPWLTARIDKVELPDGRINDEYYVLEYPDWVNVIARTRDGKFVMVEQYRHGLGDTFTELVAGVIEKGESPEDAAKRELAEESGYTGGVWKEWMTISANPASTTNLTHCYFADGVELTETQHLDDTEDVTVKILTESELYNLLESGKLKQALMAAPLWKYFACKHMKK